MQNRYSPPQAPLDLEIDVENNSGGGRAITPPPGVAGWSWGAFLLNWIWSAPNKVWIGLFALLPYVGFLMAVYLGVKGRELAWRNKRWDGLDHFNRVQKRWSIWGGVLVGGSIVVGILAAIAIPAYQRYLLRNAGV